MTTPTTPVQFYKTSLYIGGVAYPVLPNSTELICPRNFAVPPIIGNFWQLNYADGLRQPVVNTQIVVRSSTASGEALSSTLLDYFFTRSADLAHDLSNISGGVVFFDGASAFRLGGGSVGVAKANAFSLMSSKGEDLVFNCQFLGTSLTPVTTAGLSAHAWNKTPPLRFQNCNFSNVATTVNDRVWRFKLDYSNNCNPNLAMDNSVFPTDINAGMMQSSVSISLQANDTPPADETSLSLTIYAAGLIQAVSNGNDGAGGLMRTFTMPNIINNTRDNRQLNAPRIMREYQYLCLGGDSQTIPPLSYS